MSVAPPAAAVTAVTALTALTALTGLSACHAGPPPRVLDADGCEVGRASFYASSLTGHLTADGERYDPRERTAAHRSLPFGTEVVVERRGLTTRVRINDRGPFRGHRILDLSRAAARDLQMLGLGVAEVRLCPAAPAGSRSP